MTERHATKRILIIDDAPADRMLTIRALTRQLSGFDALEVTNRQQLEIAVQQGAFDAVVTDFRLGWMDGFQVLHLVKQKAPDCPVIMFTSTGTEEIAVKGIKADLDDYVVKSAQNFDKLADAVQRALEQRSKGPTTVRCLLMDDDRITLEGLQDFLARRLAHAVVDVSSCPQQVLRLA